MNTTFFYRKVKAHNSRNRILNIYDENGEHITDNNEVKKMVVQFLKTCLKNRGTNSGEQGNTTQIVRKKSEKRTM